MPALQPRTQLFEQPWVVLCGYFMFSTTALMYRLDPHEDQTRKAADLASRVWSDSSPAAYEEAKQLSNQVLDVVLQDSLSTFFLLNCMTATAALTWVATKVVFLGRLTVIETNKLTERLLMFVLLKIVFFGAVVNPTYRDVGTWLTWFCVMGYLKMFVGLAGDRCEALLSSPASTPLQHLRCLVLLLGILVHMAGWMADYVRNMGEDANLGSAALWLFDGTTVVVEATHGMIKYGVHALERWRALRAEKAGEDGAGPWEWQGSFLYHLELCCDLLLHFLTMAHYAHLWFVHGLRFQLVDMVLFLDVRYLAVVIWRRLRGYRRYRRLTQLVQHSFPDATPGQLAGSECAICMERMASAKQLPCGHVFHLPCLRAWLQQCRAGVFSCPMCRASLLAEEGEQGQQLQRWGGPAGPDGAGGQRGPAGMALAAGWHQHEHQHGHEDQLLQNHGRLPGPPMEHMGALLAALLAGPPRGRPLGVPAPADAVGSAGMHGAEAAPAPAGQWLPPPAAALLGRRGESEGYVPSVDRAFWAALENSSEEAPPGSGITLTSSSAGAACSWGAWGAGAYTAGCRAGGGVAAGEELEDTAAGPSRWQLGQQQQQEGESARPMAGGEGAEGPGEGGGTAVAAAAAAVAAEQLLRSLSYVVSQLTQSAARQGAVAAGEGDGEEVDQPVAAASPPPPSSLDVTPPRRRYKTRYQSRLGA